MWTLAVFITIGGSSIVVDGFSNPDDCRYLGQLNREFVNPKAKFDCTKTGKPPVKCIPDTRTYGRTGECLTKEPENGRV